MPGVGGNNQKVWTNTVPAHKWETYFACLTAGIPRHKAAVQAGIAVGTVERLHREPRKSSGYAQYVEWCASYTKDVIPPGKLHVQARRAVKDFGFFRERYFGHISAPWQTEAGHRMRELMESPDKRFTVVNAPPGSGKSTLFTHDYPIWEIVKNRALRVLIGTGAENTGQDYTMRIRMSLERTIQVEADEIEKAQGLAKNATACLVHDFGRFKPEGSATWRADKLVVARQGGQAAHQKEASFASFGQKSGFLGGRYNLVIWDDLVNDRNSRSPLQLEELARWYKRIAETRLEPGGLLILQGQRLGAHDLYRYALDLRDIAEALDADVIDLEQLPRKYHHIVYKAHYEDRCLGPGPGEHHDPKTAKPYPDGCLLDPIRLTYKDLRVAQYNDPKDFACVMQQEDTDPGSVLVNPIWITGGDDPVTKEIFPGCWDLDRMVGQWPRNLAGEVKSVVCADPSPSNFWAVGWWGYQMDNGYQHLIDLERKRMEAPDLLDWNNATQEFTGLLEDWYQASVAAGHPLQYVIVEANAAQRFILQYDHARRWSATRGVQLVSHQTQRNKSDEKLGVHTLAPEYRFGRVRWPGHQLTRTQILPFYNEVTRYPDSATTDCVMQHWFLRMNAETLFTRKLAKPPTFARPTWIRERQRGFVA